MSRIPLEAKSHFENQHGLYPLSKIPEAEGLAVERDVELRFQVAQHGLLAFFGFGNQFQNRWDNAISE